MAKLKDAILRTPALGRSLLIVLRARTALRYLARPLPHFFRWLFTSRETTNFTYDLEEPNRRYLASLIADIVGRDGAEILAYIQELENDEALRAHIRDATRGSAWAFVADSEVRFGRRIGWYALARALKPKVIVETGVDKGLGACVLTAALERNAREGHPGQYFGTDINPASGYLLSGIYANHGRVLYGDSIESLQRLPGPIDMFINDSDHSAEYEAAEYRTVADKLSEEAVILGDNSHVTEKLLDFSWATGRHFVYFQERPRAHWYPGGGVGISFRRQFDREAPRTQHPGGSASADLQPPMDR